MKKILLIIVLLIVSNTIHSQQIGYITGLSNISINNTKYYQPIYGISLSNNYKYIGLETNVIYYQALNKRVVQSDYIKYSLQGNVGYFSNKIGIFTGINPSYNACIHHSNIQNHTNISIALLAGIQYRIISKVTLDIKCLYDKGLTNGYMDKNTKHKYSGNFILIGLKYSLK
jgi:opacity protein-like surface antigen